MDIGLVATPEEFADKEGLKERFTPGKGDSPSRSPVLPVAADSFVKGIGRKGVTRFSDGASATCRSAGKSGTGGTGSAVDQQFRGSRSFPGGGSAYRDGF